MRDVIKKVRHALKQNAPSILSGLAIGGIATTGYLGFKSGYKVGFDNAVNDDFEDVDDRTKFLIQRHWKTVIPPVAAGVTSAACIVGASHISLRRGVAAQAAFVITERAYQEYREKVIEEFGEQKDQRIRDEINTERVERNQPPTYPVIVVDSDSTMCCELYTGRYFLCDMERLRRAENELNARLLKHDQVTLEEWHDMINVPSTSIACDLGWTSDRLMELEFTSILAENGRPVLAFDYSYIRPLYEGVFES